MRNLTIIAAIGKNNELGNNNELIWKIPGDMKFFKENTIGKSVVMGMNTLKSLPGLLPNRKHIVLTHQEVDFDSNIIVFHNKKDLLDYITGLDEEVMIIGGAQIYSLLIEYADKMLLTEIDDTSEADTYFPKFNKDDWNNKILGESKYQGINYKHVEYIRK